MQKEDYLRERKILIDAELHQSLQFDKYILTLGGGSFGLSFAFIQQLAPSPVDGSIKLLCIAWSGFALSILSTLISFLFSQEAYRKQRAILGDVYCSKDGTTILAPNNIFAGLTKYLNWASMLLFMIGLIFLIWYAVKNIGA